MRAISGDVIADKYRLEQPLGEGGMGTVFAAVNVVTGKQVAIKWLRAELTPEEYVQRFMREAQVASRIEHPNVVNVFDMGRHEGALFLVMELLHGEPLSHWLERGIPEPRELLNLMIPVMRGLHAAHRMGVVHRDLKPDNIFLCRDAYGDGREPKVLDFGISKISEGSLVPLKQLTQEGAIFGTPQYMAPEQLRNVRTADARSDIYSLGVILYRALAGRLPYDADMLPALVLQVVEAQALHLSHVCPELELSLADAVMRAMAPDPADRFRSVADLARALEQHASVRFETTASSWMTSSSSSSLEGRGARVRTPPSGPPVSREPTPSFGERDSLEDGRSTDPLDLGRVSAEVVPTPIHGLLHKDSPSRSRWLTRGAVVLLILLPALAFWLWPKPGGPATTVQARQVPQPPAPPNVSAPAGVPPQVEGMPAQALPPEPVPEVTPIAPSPSVRETATSDVMRRVRVERQDDRTAPATAPATERAPKTPIATPEAQKDTHPASSVYRDPTLKSDSNPYLHR